MDRPATPQAMREALVELAHLQEISAAAVFNAGECPAEEVPDEEDEEVLLNTADFVAEEKEDEKAYADKLWIQVDSSESCWESLENCVVIVSYKYMMIVSNFGPANVQIHTW